MLKYRNFGIRQYGINPVQPYARACWEFEACLQGMIAPLFPAPASQEDFHGETLWAFPGGVSHGWTGRGEEEAEIVVFHCTVVPEELSRLLPPRGYYRVPLSGDDGLRLRSLAALAEEMTSRPTELLNLQNRALTEELSLMALREGNPRPLSSRGDAFRKTEEALGWYAEHLGENPGLERIARAVFLSPAHLRRLFHEAREESPHQSFHRLRMSTISTLLTDPRLSLEEIAKRTGFSGASALSRAFKTHFHTPPRGRPRARE